MKLVRTEHNEKEKRKTGKEKFEENVEIKRKM